MARQADPQDGCTVAAVSLTGLTPGSLAACFSLCSTALTTLAATLAASRLSGRRVNSRTDDSDQTCLLLVDPGSCSRYSAELMICQARFQNAQM
jgi:hypothetical protein